jgi:hypothetical protein
MSPYIHEHFESLLAEPTPILIDPEVGLQTMAEEGAILEAAVVTQLTHKHLIIVFITRIVLFL